MENTAAITEKILDSMKSIFAFSRFRVSDATQAEALSQQMKM